MKMKSTKFYTIARLGLQTDWFVNLHESLKGKVSDVDVWSYVTGRARPQAPLKLRLKGRKSVDLIYGLNTFFVHPRVVDLATANHFTGWGTFPIHIVAPKQLKVTYVGLVFKGRAGRLLGRRGFDPTRFDPAAWDGSDFFMLEDAALQFVTERVVNIFKANSVTGAEFEAVDLGG
jgi:hypothetical protein